MMLLLSALFICLSLAANPHGTLLANGCPSDYPERYPNTNRCFGSKWANLGCNIDPRHDPVADHRADPRCVFTNFVYVKFGCTNVEKWMDCYICDTLCPKAAQTTYESLSCRTSDGFEEYFIFESQTQRHAYFEFQTTSNFPDWFNNFDGMAEMWAKSGIQLYNNDVAMTFEEYDLKYKSSKCDKVQPLHGTRTGNGCPTNVPERYPRTDRCFERKWEGVMCNVNANQAVDPVCQYEEDRYLTPQAVTAYENRNACMASYSSIGGGHCVDSSDSRPYHCWGSIGNEATCQQQCTADSACEAYEYGQNYGGILCQLIYLSAPSCPLGMNFGDSQGGTAVVKTFHNTGGTCYKKNSESRTDLAAENSQLEREDAKLMNAIEVDLSEPAEERVGALYDVPGVCQQNQGTVVTTAGTPIDRQSCNVDTDKCHKDGDGGDAKFYGPSKCALSYDETKLYIYSDFDNNENKIRVMETSPPYHVSTLNVNAGGGWAIVASPVGRFLYAVEYSDSQQVHQIDLNNNNAHFILPMNTKAACNRGGWFYACAISDDGAYLYLADFYCEAILKVQVSNGETTVHLNGINPMPVGLAYVDDDTFVISFQGAGSSSSVYRYTASTGAKEKLMNGVNLENPRGLSISKDKQTLYVMNSYQGTIHQVNLRTKETFAIAGKPGHQVQDVDGTGEDAIFFQQQGSAPTSTGELWFVNHWFGTIKKLHCPGTAIPPTKLMEESLAWEAVWVEKYVVVQGLAVIGLVAPLYFAYRKCFRKDDSYAAVVAHEQEI